MNTITLIAITTQIIFLIGEVPLAGYLYKQGFTLDSLQHPLFGLFMITRFLAYVGQIYLWSNTQLGLVAGLMGACGLLLSNVLGQYWLGQPPLSTTQYIGLGLVLVSLILLAHK